MNAPVTTDPAACLLSTDIVDAAHPDVRAWAEERAGDGDDRARAVALYYAVRDEIRYDPYTIRLSADGLRASGTLAAGRGWCVTKAVLLAACCRATGVPAALGYADVRNHLSTERMRASMGTDVFYFHGYTAVRLDERWIKCTPAFNRELCEKFRMHTLEFDGREDSIYHPYDLDGRQHMEYLAYRGEFADVPVEAMSDVFERHYPGMTAAIEKGDFDREVAAETGGAG